MLRILRSAVPLALLAGVVSGGVAVAAETETARGTIKSVAPAGGNQFVLTDLSGKDWTYELAKDAVIVSSVAKEPKLSDLPVGAQVTVIAEKAANRRQATTVLHHDGPYRDAILGWGTVKSSGDHEVIITDASGKGTRYELQGNSRIRTSGNKSVRVNVPGETVAIVYIKQGDRFVVMDLSGWPK